MSEDIKSNFLNAMDSWICEEYCVDIRYVALISPNGYHIWRCSIAVTPISANTNNSFCIEQERVLVGQSQRNKIGKQELCRIIQDAADGRLEIENRVLTLSGDPEFHYTTEMVYRDRWYYNLHLGINGKSVQLPSQVEWLEIDNSLRASSPPFDGLEDVFGWFGFDSAQSMGSRSSDINIWIMPPVDIIYDQCNLVGDELTICLHAHPDFDTNRMRLAIRTVPGISVNSRMQVANQIKWNLDKDLKKGVIQTKLEKADSVLSMLMVGSDTVRKQWFVDSGKARNNRYLVVQHFDKELKMAKKAVLESQDQNRFETGIALLLFLLGFTPAVQIETDSPDIVVSTPGGKILIVERTNRISDFATKVGKLVDRRGDLSKALSASGHHSQVYAVLVCKVPKDQIPATGFGLNEQNIILINGDDLERAFDRVRADSDPDALVDEAIKELEQNATMPLQL